MVQLGREMTVQSRGRGAHGVGDTLSMNVKAVVIHLDLAVGDARRRHGALARRADSRTRRPT